jgi:hypothetical protein
MTAKTDPEATQEAAERVKAAVAGPHRPPAPTGLYTVVPAPLEPAPTGRRLAASLQAGIAAKLGKPPVRP